MTCTTSSWFIAYLLHLFISVVSVSFVVVIVTVVVYVDYWDTDLIGYDLSDINFTHSLLIFGSRTLRHHTHCKGPVLDLCTIKKIDISLGPLHLDYWMLMPVRLTGFPRHLKSILGPSIPVGTWWGVFQAHMSVTHSWNTFSVKAQSWLSKPSCCPLVNISC